MELEKTNKELAEELYKMELHEEIAINDLTFVVRVIGGWIYKFYNFNDKVNELELHLTSTTFVPWTSEMQ